MMGLFILSLLFSLGVMLPSNRIYSLLNLVGVFLTVSMTLVMLGLELIGLLTVFMYVGAICILFLFVIMFIEIPYLESKSVTYSTKSQQMTMGLLILFSVTQLFNLDLLEGLNVLGEPGNTLVVSLNTFGSTSVNQLGGLLYSEYSLGVLLCATILLVAMVGAIAISSML